MFSNPVENLEIKGQEKTDSTLETSSRIIPLPADYQQARAVRLNTIIDGTIDYGLVSVVASSEEDYGSVTASTSSSDNYGLVTESTASIVLNGFEIRFRAPEQMIRYEGTGRPVFFTVVGNNIELDRSPDAVYGIELKYYGTPTPLSLTNATNTVLANNPNIYLFGSLWAVNNFAVDEVQAQKYYGQFIGAIQGANSLSRAGRYGPAPAMRIEGSTP